MPENILFMQVEDGFVTFERQTKETIIYPLSMVPIEFQEEGKLLRAIVHDEENIEFIGVVPQSEIQAEHDKTHSISSDIRNRIKNKKRKKRFIFF